MIKTWIYLNKNKKNFYLIGKLKSVDEIEDFRIQIAIYRWGGTLSVNGIVRKTFIAIVPNKPVPGIKGSLVANISWNLHSTVEW